MANDFDRIIDRRRTNSLKWHGYGDKVLPLWVADMDFRSPEPVIQALRARVEHGIFGYEPSPPELRSVIVERLARVYDWRVEPEAIVFLPGVVTGFNLAIHAFAAPDGGVLVQSPVYPPLLVAAQVVGAHSQTMELTQLSDGSYGVDFERFQRSVTPQTRLFMLCNPHNPVGRVFHRHELERMATLCLEHDLVICSDEIHCDFVFDGRQHIPIATLDPEVARRTVTLMAPSKTFNIAGLHCAFAVIPDAALRRRYQGARGGLVDSVNVLGYTAALAAYREGQPWLDDLLLYLQSNRDYLARALSTMLPEIRMSLPEGTFLAWLDCRALEAPGSPHQFFLEHAGVAFNDGSTFGPGGEGFVRLNFGCPRAILAEALDRMKTAVAAFQR